MKKNILLLLFFAIANNFLLAQNATTQNPESVIQPNANTRFTVLTSGIVRMEWSEKGKFTDNPSFVFVNRNLPKPNYTSTIKHGVLKIVTEKMIVEYKIGSRKFNKKNLSIKSPKGQMEFSWKPGDQQTQNLKGTYRTLDGYKGNMKGDKAMPIEDGLLARDGWTFIDDSNSLLFDGNSDLPWVTTRKDTAAQDWYFMAYGHNYKDALLDFTKVAGKVPLPPRYAFGYWWSRYWSYSDQEIRELVENFEKFDIPLDVLVIDMDWHLTFYWNKIQKDEFGQRVGWTGWTWNKKLFPDPQKLLNWIKSKNLKVTLNLHPASGVAAYEEKYKALAKRLNFDTSTQRNIPWSSSSKTFMKGMFDIILHPMENDGVDFWWLDWQQWIYDKAMPQLSNTWWINYAFFSDMQRNRDTRPMLYHRWGGLGNHRYQIGFSGDAIIDWKSLEFQPYFTNCASNVLYGYWSHDIGGHMFAKGQEKVLNPELYTRWLQYGVFTPIFRTHSTKDASLNKEIWNFRGQYFDAQLAAIKLRYALVPYIYTMARQCYDTGISLCRPMYYDFPENEEAYNYKNEFMFGNDILIAPIASQAKNNLSDVDVWLPHGNKWFEWNTGTMLDGGQTLHRNFYIDEYPIYIKSGAIIPMYINAKNLQSQPQNMQICVFGNDNGSAQIYEDNGNDKNYDTKYAYTNIATQWIDANTLKINIGARQGKYVGMNDKRNFEIVVYGVATAKSATIDGKPAQTKYNGNNLAAIVNLGEQNCDTPSEIIIKFNPTTHNINNGLVRKFKLLSKATTELKFKNAGIILPEAIGKAEETSIALEYFPDKFDELIENFETLYQQIPQSLNETELSDETKKWYLNLIELQSQKNISNN